MSPCAFTPGSRFPLLSPPLPSPPPPPPQWNHHAYITDLYYAYSCLKQVCRIHTQIDQPLSTHNIEHV